MSVLSNYTAAIAARLAAVAGQAAGFVNAGAIQTGNPVTEPTPGTYTLGLNHTAQAPITKFSYSGTGAPVIGTHYTVNLATGILTVLDYDNSGQGYWKNNNALFFCDFTAGNGAALLNVPVVVEDAQDLETQISKATSEEGLLILIGMPSMDNTAQSVSVADFKITSIIDVGENPTISRALLVGTNFPVCLDVVQSVVSALQGFLVTGFARRLNVTRVETIPVKDKQLYRVTIESRAVIDATST